MLFAELLNLLPTVPTHAAGTAVSVAKLDPTPVANAGATQSPQVHATTAMATNISWPVQTKVSTVNNTQPMFQPVIQVTSANAVSACTQVSTVSVGTSTAPTVAVSANPVVVSAVANPTQPVVIVKQYQTPKPYSSQTSHKSFREHFDM